MRCHNVIPHGRGLGSSSAAVVAGIVAARALLAEPRAVEAGTVLALATEFEGHPDNAAPAIQGGATVAWTTDDGPRAVGLDVDPTIEATVLVPDSRLATARARAALPERVSHADAAFTAGRAALLVEALARRPELLFDATEDRLHQPYRAAVLGASSELVLAGPEHRARRDAVLADLVDETAGWRRLSPGIDMTGARARRVTGNTGALSSGSSGATGRRVAPGSPAIRGGSMQ
jgi:homoserine kinase